MPPTSTDGRDAISRAGGGLDHRGGHHAFIQNLRRGDYELAVDLDSNHRLPAAFTELALAI
jgi:hypothetical protein